MRQRIFAYVLTAGLILGMTGAFAGDTGSAAGKVKLSKKKLTLKTGDTARLKVKNTNKKVKWSSKNTRIAKVSKKGVVKGVSAGKTKIIAKTGKKKLVCGVTVKEKAVKIAYKNDVFDSEVYKNIKYITCKSLYHNGEKISSAEGISAIYKVLAGIDSMKDITSENPTPPAGGTVIEFVMKDGAVETVNVSENICFKDKWYQPGQTVGAAIADLVKKYIN